MKEIIQKQEELIKRKCKHSSDCWINQNWDEALDALADTPEQYRDNGWYYAHEEIEKKRHTCSCGLDDLYTELALLQEQDKPISDEAIEEWADDFLKDRRWFAGDNRKMARHYLILAAKAYRDGLIPPKDNDR